MSAAAGASAAAAAAIAQAVRAAGVIVRVEPEAFLTILRRHGEPLVVHAFFDGYFRKFHQYLTSYKGLAFYVQSPSPIDLPAGVERVEAQGIWIPG
jgi:hypothetical protein